MRVMQMPLPKMQWLLQEDALYLNLCCSWLEELVHFSYFFIPKLLNEEHIFLLICTYAEVVIVFGLLP